jgi:hypothetical protein
MKLIDLGPGHNDCPCGCGNPARMWTIEGFDGYVDAAKECAQQAMIDAIEERDQ